MSVERRGVQLEETKHQKYEILLTVSTVPPNKKTAMINQKLKCMSTSGVKKEVVKLDKITHSKLKRFNV